MSQKSRGRRAGRLSIESNSDSSFSAGGHRTDRKERQLCRQVQEAVAEALASFDDDVLNQSWVAGVEPAPDTSRLLVIVEIARGTAPDLALARLTRASGNLRTEVAQAITRKRAPVLIFQVLAREETE